MLALLPLLLTACTDTCDSYVTYSVFEPVYMSYSELRQPVKSAPAEEINRPGKIYVYQHYLLVNEVKKGIHIIDNRNPATPQKVAFVPIPGNVDMAIKDGFLYADSFVDLVVLDFGNPRDVQEVKRLEDAFPMEMSWEVMRSGTGSWDASMGVVAEWNEEVITEKADCASPGFAVRPGWFFAERAMMSDASMAPPAGGQTGTGGSMARFAVTSGHLYAVNSHSMNLFNVTDPADPVWQQEVYLGFGIETIFPYKNTLFIGAVNGMHIYDNTQPAQPQHLATYSHINACDPVVVNDEFAYVTLRSGTECDGFSNQLDVVNITDLSNPELHKTYPMQNPHGLGLDGEQLFICEGAFGLKHFNAANPDRIDQNLVKHHSGMHAYDVIPLDNLLIMIGDDGLYQYDYSDPQAMQLLSVIPVEQLLE